MNPENIIIESTKISEAKKLYEKGDKIGALRIVSRFPRLGKEKDSIKLAIDCVNNKDFYSHIGKNVEECIQYGVKAMIKKYGWEK